MSAAEQQTQINISTELLNLSNMKAKLIKLALHDGYRLDDENGLLIAGIMAEKYKIQKPNTKIHPPKTHQIDRKSTRLNSSHLKLSRMPSSA